jgi:hypothetical protein
MAGDWKGGGLADPQTATLKQAKSAAVNRVANATRNALDLGMGKDQR